MSMKNNKPWVGLAAAVLLPGLLGIGIFAPGGSAHALETDRRGPYLGLGWGRYSEETDVRFSATENNYARKLIVGYHFLDMISLEVGYTNFDKMTAVLSSGNVDTFENESYLARANLGVPLYRGDTVKAVLYAAGGVHRWYAQEKVTTTAGVEVSSARKHENDALLAAGVMVRGKEAAFRLEYERYKGINLSGNLGEMDLNLISLNFLFFF
jgi:hypothetical protein